MGFSVTWGGLANHIWRAPKVMMGVRIDLCAWSAHMINEKVAMIPILADDILEVSRVL